MCQVLFANALIKSTKTNFGVKKIRYLDEEVGGHKGMEKFVSTEPFQKLNVGFSLDEGIASPSEDFNVYYAERTIWQITFKCFGRSGHGSMLFKDTPGEKIHYIVSKLMEMRARAVDKLDQNPELDLGDVTSVNLTMLTGGQQQNVVPPEMSATFDIRLANDIDLHEFEQQVITASNTRLSRNVKKTDFY